MPGSVDVDVLARSVVLGTLPRSELEGLVSSFRRRNYRRGETIMHQGDPGNVVHVVCDGRVKVVLPSEGGDEAVLTLPVPGDALGDMALLDGEPRSATAVALEPVITATLSRETFLELLQRSPAAVEGVL